MAIFGFGQMIQILKKNPKKIAHKRSSCVTHPSSHVNGPYLDGRLNE